MLTAILPIRIDQNPFWTSSRGIECVENFLKTCKRISAIDRFVVITRDDPVRQSAKHHRMEISTIDIPGSADLPYTFDQTRLLARNFQNFCKNQTDTLIIADHRNLFLSADDVVKALAVYQQNSEAGVISLAFCRDYPCQYRSYFTFLGCVIMRFDKPEGKDGSSDIPQTGFLGQITCQLEGHGQITISVSTNGPRSLISFVSQNLPRGSLVAQLLPFDQDGPRYGQSRKILVPTPEYETRFDIDLTQLSGIIFILAVPAQSGEYDTVEVFAPANAPWELGGSGATVVNTKTHEPMYGRQQFPPVYTYNGSLCILGAKHLPDKSPSNPFPLILKDSCIVTDWVDYWYTVTAQFNSENLTN